ncbi:hypothetical protein [Chitinophaga varians]|uniref:hypothetical protein n=1 Tax=Chitinophaga varians TaxID=2202339 RepID=UPI00165F3033|nr:hypothetical protein [Chitinophaga varians]MBC9914053.1 hypothetical protein [Chitinophaga varians]
MIMEKLNKWSARWGSIFVVSVGVLLILITAIWQWRGGTSYEYYDLRRHNGVVDITLEINYALGSLMLLVGFRKAWLVKWKSKVKQK